MLPIKILFLSQLAGALFLSSSRIRTDTRSERLMKSFPFSLTRFSMYRGAVKEHVLMAKGILMTNVCSISWKTSFDLVGGELVDMRILVFVRLVTSCSANASLQETTERYSLVRSHRLYPVSRFVGISWLFCSRRGSDFTRTYMGSFLFACSHDNLSFTILGSRLRGQA